MTDKTPKAPIWTLSPWSWFFSLKVGIVVLAVITVASIYGTLIDPLERAQQMVFYAWWYQALLLLLAINMSCTTWRTLAVKVLPLRVPRFLRQPQVYATMKPGQSVPYKGDAVKAGEAFRAKSFRVFVEGPFGYARRGLLAWWGAPISHIGFIVVLLGGFAAGMVNREGVVQLVEGGRTDTMQMRTVEREIHDLGFTLICDDFHTEFFPKTRTPSTFTSLIGVIEDGERTQTGIVEVNQSMKVHGWILHQTSYQEVPQLARYNMIVEGPELGEPAELEVSLGQRRPIPGLNGAEIELVAGPGGRWVIWQGDTRVAEGGQAGRTYRFDLAAVPEGEEASHATPFTLIVGEEKQVDAAGQTWLVRALQFEPDFVIGPDRLATSRTENLNNPALRVMFKGADGVEHTQWLFGREDMRAMSHSGGGSVRFELTKVNPIIMEEPAETAEAASNGGWRVTQGERVTAYATVLTLTRNPVFPFIYAGCTVMMLGLMVAFFIRRREVWFYVDSAKGRLSVIAQYRHSTTELDGATRAAIEALAEPAAAKSTEPEHAASPAS